MGGAYDSEEFPHVAYTLGIAHPTGYPLYLLLSKIWITLIPLGNVAYRMNLFSAFLTAITAVVVFNIIAKWTRHMLIAFGCALYFATGLAVWRHAAQVSVAPLNSLLLALCLLGLVLWRERRASLAFPLFMFGLGLAHHRSMLFIAPALVLFIFLSEPKLLRQPKAWLVPLAALVTPLLLYLYIPLRGDISPWYANTLNGFMEEVFSNQPIVDFMPTDLASFFSSAKEFLLILNQWLGYTMLLVIVGALAALPGRANNPRYGDTVSYLSFGVATLAFTAFGFVLPVFDGRYLGPVFMCFVFWIALGLVWLDNKLSQLRVSRAVNFAARAVLFAGLSVAFLFSVKQNYALVDQSKNDRVYRFWNEVFDLPLASGAYLAGNWAEVNAMRYFQYVERRRTDLVTSAVSDNARDVQRVAKESKKLKRPLYLPPGVPPPEGFAPYASIGPLVRVGTVPLTASELQAPIARSVRLLPQLQVIGYGLERGLESDSGQLTTFQMGDSVRLTLYWLADASVKQDYNVAMRSTDAQSKTNLAQTVSPPVRGYYPMTEWEADEEIVDAHSLMHL